MVRSLMTTDYFRQKTTAVSIINLVNYLNEKEITEENLKNEDTVRNILREGMKMKAAFKTNEINEFKKTILNFKIDYLKKTNLYEINRGILAVACVEHVLYPKKDHEEYGKIYGCDKFKATTVYKKLREHCGFTTEDELDLVKVKSARSFFKCGLFLNKKTSLETIRFYLKSVNINDKEKIYIKNASLQIIDNNETINIIQSKKNFMDKEYFQNICKADVMINFVNYLEKKEVKEKDLEDEKILIDILCEGMKYYVKHKPTKFQLKEFKKTILNFKIDYLTVTNLYRINRAILTVVCVEYVLFPGQDYEEYRKIYSCNYPKATAVYKELCGIPKEVKVNEAVAKSARSFFHNDRFLKKENGCLETVRSYLEGIEISSEEIEYIKNASIELIKSNEAFYAAKPKKNRMDQIKDRPINVTTDDEETLPPMPDMPLVHVEPPSVVPIPVDQGFLSRYSPNEVVLAKRFNSYFWPAQIIEVYSDKMYVTFFPLSEEMKKEEVSSEKDVKAFTEEEIDATRASLCTGLSRKAFDHAVLFASAELN